MLYMTILFLEWCHPFFSIYLSSQSIAIFEFLLTCTMQTFTEWEKCRELFTIRSSVKPKWANIYDMNPMNVDVLEEIQRYSKTRKQQIFNAENNYWTNYWNYNCVLKNWYDIYINVIEIINEVHIHIFIPIILYFEWHFLLPYIR